jgi:N-acetylmuramoyl-L-alanine amidase
VLIGPVVLPKRLAALGVRGLLIGVLGASAGACGNAGPGAGTTDAGTGADAEVAGARAWLAPDAKLPSRAEVIAVSDRLAIDAVKNERTGRAAELRILAGDLRVKLYRSDGLDTDAREALELYAAALRDAPADDASCDVARRRATLSGELAGDAAAAHRELFIAKRRQVTRLGDAASRSACIARIDRDLAMLAAYRPTGAALETLEAEADRAAREIALEVAKPAPSGEPARPPTSSAPTSPIGGAQVVSPDATMVAKGPVQLTKIETYPAENGGRVVLHLSGVTTFEVGTLAGDATGDKGPRIYLDLAKAKSKGVPAETKMGGGVERVRVGKRDEGTRIVLDLKSALHHRVFYLPEPFRIVVDLSSRAPEADPRTPEGKRVLKRVAIDPGHGGYDSGAVGPTGLREKDVALDVAHRVAPLLAHELHVETLLTRDGDVFVPLEERTARANAFHADLFVSVHCNASENGEARGVETFVLDPSREGRASARIVALENGLFDGKKPPSPAKVDAEIEKALGRLTIGDNGARSRQFGELLQRATLASMAKRYDGTRDHGVKTAVFYVLAGAEMPAVLYETSFISNPDDEARLATADYRQKLADAIVNAVRAYRDGK